MRKGIKLLGAMALVGAMAFSTSCKKNEQTTSSTNVALPQVKIVNVDSERAYIDYEYGSGNVMRWEAGDQLQVYNLHRVYTRSESEVYDLDEGFDGSTQASFHGKPMHRPYTDGYLIFYPAWKVYGGLQEGNRQDFLVPADQNYQYGLEQPRADRTSLVMAGKVAQLDEQTSLHHIFGFANFRVRGDSLPDEYQGARIKEVVLHSNNIHITGNVSVKLPGVDPDQLLGLIDQCSSAQTDDEKAAYWSDLRDYLFSEPVGYDTSNQGFDITLHCDQGLVTMGSQVNHFIFSLRPGCLIDGFTVTVNFVDDTLEPIVIHKYEHSDWRYCVYPGMIKNFNCNYTSML